MTTEDFPVDELFTATLAHTELASYTEVLAAKGKHILDRHIGDKAVEYITS